MFINDILLPSSVASARSVGSPSLQASINLQPSTIAAPRSVGSPAMHATVLPSSVASARSVGSPTVVGADLLLDGLQAPLFAGSLSRRRLSAYSGALWRIQSTGTGTPQGDVGYDGSNVAAIADAQSVCGTNDGALIKLYDQSGAANHISVVGTGPNAYTGATETFLTYTGATEDIYYANFNGAPYLKIASALGISGSITVVAIWQSNSTTSQALFMIGPVGSNDFALFNGADLGIVAESATGSPATGAYGSLGSWHYDMVSVQDLTDMTTKEWIQDGSAVTLGSITGSAALTDDRWSIGAQTGGGLPLHGYLSDLFVWSGALSSGDKSTLESRISAEYGF